MKYAFQSIIIPDEVRLTEVIDYALKYLYYRTSDGFLYLNECLILKTLRPHVTFSYWCVSHFITYVAIFAPFRVDLHRNSVFADIWIVIRDRHCGAGGESKQMISWLYKTDINRMHVFVNKFKITNLIAFKPRLSVSSSLDSL